MKQLSTYANKVRMALIQSGGVLAYLFASMAFAASGGLDEATNVVNEVRIWFYGFLGVIAFLFLMYRVSMVFLDRMMWSDVLIGLGYVAGAGGIIVAGEWAWAIWGS